MKTKIKLKMSAVFKKKPGHHAGFSLIEVLVAMGIVSLLAGVGAPKYIEHKRRTKQVEAKSTLGRIYSAQENFYSTWGTYTPNLIYLGAVPKGHVIYNAGFDPDQDASSPGLGLHLPDSAKKGPNTNNLKDICGCEFGGNATANCSASSGTGASSPGEQCAFGSGNKTFSSVNLPDIDESGTCASSITKTQFTAVAFADLINIPQKDAYSNLNELDVWTINHYKQVEHMQDGVEAGTDASIACST